MTSNSSFSLTLGAVPSERGTRFEVWAPRAERVELVLEPSGDTLPMTAADGYFVLEAPVPAGARYRYRLDGRQTFPDPASRFQPDGVHGPSEVVDPGRFAWTDADWWGVPQKDLVFYELHVGTFTESGTFAGLVDKLAYLKSLGVTALELLPVADFPGARNWGYDPAAFYAPSRSYGRPDDLRRLVNEAHRQGLAVFLDVVYNHFGPDGAYPVAFDPEVLTDRYSTPWGKAVDLERPAVRRFFLENAFMWLSEYHLDGFRLDAIFALFDTGPQHFLAELATAVAQLPGPRRILIGEDYRNENIVVTPQAAGGYGLDGVWADDFHHHLRRALTGDRHAYFAAYSGDTAALAETVSRGWYYDGRLHAPTGVPRGTPPEGVRPEQLVYCLQNHDQTGNRPFGDRLNAGVTPAAYRAASALLLFCPALPLLFMGQEWAASTPFQYFTDHEPTLGAAVREGRKEEFADFPGFGDETGQPAPDPQAVATFLASKLEWEELQDPDHAHTLELYRDLLRLRRTLQGDAVAVSPAPGGLVVTRGEHTLLVALAPDVTLPLDEDFGEVWRSEREPYADTLEPPTFSANEVHFTRAGALLVQRGTLDEPAA